MEKTWSEDAPLVLSLCRVLLEVCPKQNCLTLVESQKIFLPESGNIPPKAGDSNLPTSGDSIQFNLLTLQEKKKKKEREEGTVGINKIIPKILIGRRQVFILEFLYDQLLLHCELHLR